MAKVSVHPIGEIPGEVLREIASGLEKVYNAPAVIGDPFPVPKVTYNPRRRQYYSPSILVFLQPEPEKLLLGVCDLDLYAPGLNFVFGQADPRLGVAIISLTRLRPEFYRLPPDESLFKLRAVKEAVHEVGHLYGLNHCPDRSCVMAFSNSLEDTDKKGVDLCPSCRRRLQ